MRDFLKNGENCLLFAYGSTGSGKTYTVQGGAGEDAGLLPRVVDVVWKSLEAKVRSFSAFLLYTFSSEWETDSKGMSNSQRQNPRATTPPAGRRPGGPLMSTPNGKQAAPERDAEGDVDTSSDGESCCATFKGARPENAHLSFFSPVVQVDGAYDYAVMVSCEREWPFDNLVHVKG